MKMIVAVAFALVAVVAAAPVDQQNVPQIVRSEFTQKPEGDFNYAYETENGIQAQAEGTVKQVVDKDNVPQSVVVVRGSYTFPGVDGVPITITYLADEFGYHPEGDSIPKSN